VLREERASSGEETIAPEVWRGGLVGPSTDLYALGVLAYEMLAGKTPFSATDVARLGLLHCYQPVPPLPDAVPGMVRELVYWMLEKDPVRRPASGAEIAESIEDLLAEGIG
jgi:serine/threonine-protein kinase